MFQVGYLTICAVDSQTGRYRLVVPNAEVKWGLVEDLLSAWTSGYSASRGTDVFTLLNLVEAGDTEDMRDVLAALFASISYERAEDSFEKYLQAVLWPVFTLLGYLHAYEGATGAKTR